MDVVKQTRRQITRIVSISGVILHKLYSFMTPLAPFIIALGPRLRERPAAARAILMRHHFNPRTNGLY